MIVGQNPTKVCVKCKVEKPLNEFHWERDKRRNECMGCHRQYCKEWYEKTSQRPKRLRSRPIIDGYRQCATCNVSKPISKFYPDGVNKQTGVIRYRPDCGTCCSKRSNAARWQRIEKGHYRTRKTKVCYLCNKRKPVKSFFKNAHSPDCLSSACKPCAKAKVADWLSVPENKVRHKRKSRNHHLRMAHSITLEQYEAMLEAQGHACAICKAPNDPKRFLHVDHDHQCCPGNHSCGKCVRSLLCYACNAGLGHFRDSPALLEKAVEYLKNYGK